MIMFFDDEADFIRHYAKLTEDDGWECRMTPTVDELLECLSQLEERDKELHDDPDVVVVDIMMPTASGIAKDIEDKLNVGIFVIEEYLLDKMRRNEIKIVVLTNKNSGLVLASLREIGVDSGEIPVWAKHDVSAANFPKQLEKFLDS